ncbi:MAG: CCDC90 family protein [Candidatus Magnetoovum sp. WYHC-5]|nr:CCDC90 family protein [Candidatus Magnetoovum sp. WYHC-5]
MAKTLELYNALKDKIGEEGTRVVIEAFDEVVDKGHGNLATKEDLLKVESKLDSKIDKLDNKIDKVELTLRGEIEKSRAESKTEIEKAKSDLLRWMFIFWASQIGIIIALVKLLP